MPRRIAAHRTYLGWDLFYEPHHTGLNWTGRVELADGGHKYRAETLAELKSAIRQVSIRKAR